MAARDAAVRVEAHPGEHVAAECLRPAPALRVSAAVSTELVANRARRAEPARICSISAEALLDLADANPDARIDVALLERRAPRRLSCVVGRIAGTLARVEGAAEARPT